MTFHEPLGVVGIIVPWNFPMPIAAWGFAPALAAGNTVVLKPAELTPLTALRIGELAVEAGLPRDVLTVVPGKGSVVGERFVSHPLVRKVCFTGSTEVGKRVMRGCADQVKRCTLELGGKSANIVFSDTDLTAAAAAAPYAAFDNAGQDCCSRSRILVGRSVHDEFLGRLESAVTGMRVLVPTDRDSEMGPLISAEHRERVLGHLDGVDVAFRGTTPDGPGFWVRPTVVLPGSTADPIWREVASGRSSRCCRSTTRRTPSSSPTTATTVSPARSSPPTSAALCGWPVPSRRATSASTATPRCASGRPSAGTSSPDSVASSGRMPPRRSPRRRTSSSPTRTNKCGSPCSRAARPGAARPELTTGEDRMTGRLEGRTAVVTGGCSGIGLATVERFAEEGAHVVIADLDDTSGREVAQRVDGLFVHCDVTSKDEVDALFAATKERFGAVDIAFNKAGISPPEDDSILDTDLEAWRRVQEVNLTSVYLCCKAVLPYMLEQGRGSIINTASFVAVMGAATSQISYSASKGGVLSMSRELGVQFARQGVRVNALCPGPVNTPLLQELFAKDAERAQRRLVHIPMGRFAEPREVANAALFVPRL